MSDPLSILRDCINQGILIRRVEENNDTYIILKEFKFKAVSTTAYKSKSGRGEYYTLSALWNFFDFFKTKGKSSYSEYFKKCKESGFPKIELVDKSDLMKYLETGESQFLDAGMLYADESVNQSVESNSFESKIELSIEEVLKQEKPLLTREELLLSPNKSFASALTLYDGVINVSSSSSSSITHSHEKTKSRGRNHTSQSSLQGVLPPLPKHNLDHHKNKKMKKMSAIPIIIVPSASTALINLYNCKEFLQLGSYLPPLSLKLKSEKNGTDKSNIVHIKRSSYNDQSRTVIFEVRDSVIGLKGSDWDRIVAVFVHGPQWQFQGWKWSDPAQLFMNVRGFYLYFDDEKTHSNVLNWNVHKLSISKMKRYLDKSTAFEFWKVLFEFMVNKKSKLFF